MFYSPTDLRQELDVSKMKKEKGDADPPTPAVVKVKPEVKVEPQSPPVTNHLQTPSTNIYKENQSHSSMLNTPSRPGLLRSKFNRRMSMCVIVGKRVGGCI